MDAHQPNLEKKVSPVQSGCQHHLIDLQLMCKYQLQLFLILIASKVATKHFPLLRILRNDEHGGVMDELTRNNKPVLILF